MAHQLGSYGLNAMIRRRERKKDSLLESDYNDRFCRTYKDESIYGAKIVQVKQVLLSLICWHAESNLIE